MNANGLKKTSKSLLLFISTIQLNKIEYLTLVWNLITERRTPLGIFANFKQSGSSEIR